MGRCPAQSRIAWIGLLAGATSLAVDAAMAGQFSYKSGGLMAPGQCASELWYAGDAEALGAEIECRGDAPLNLKIKTSMPRDGANVHGLEAEYQLRDYGNGRYALGVNLSASLDDATGRVTGTKLIVPFSVHAAPGLLDIHFNLGASHSRVTDDTQGYWGVAAELYLGETFSMVGETLATGSKDPTVHGGLQASLMNGRLTLSLSYRDDTAPSGAQGWSAGADFRVLTF